MERREHPKRKRVAVIVGTEMACFREALRGINGYAATDAVWHIESLSPFDDFVGFLRQTKPEGLLLGQVTSHDERVAALDLVQNCVSVIGQHSPTGVRRIPEVEADDEAVGEMAAKFFFEKGFKSFAFLGTDANWSNSRWIGFQRAVTAFGLEPAFMQKEEGGAPIRRGWERPHYGNEIIGWIQSLPMPLAVFACNDIRGRELAELCLEAGLDVPDTVAIIGVDNDDLECELSHPPLSSVCIPWRVAGHRAASLLNDLLMGTPVEAVRHLIAPTAVIERHSTETLAIDDREVAGAIQYIRDHANERIGVDDVLRAVPASRRSLETRFRKTLGRTLHEEIRRVRIERAKHLLATTNLTMPEIAEKSGFASAAWFSNAFSEITGEAPIRYRSRLRPTA